MAELLQRKRLGATGPEVSRLCLGTMMFGDRTDEAEATDMVARYLEAGGNFVDTADTYSGGASERITGRALEGRRDDVVLATKVGNPVKDVAGSGGLSARWIGEALKHSLDRLRTDVIDLYWLHLDDEGTPLEETVGALGRALADGKIRAWGFSNYHGWRIAELVRVADSLGVARPLAGQPYYHALYRLVEIDYLPACGHFGIGVVPYSPLARGVLTGKYADGIPEASRAARGDKRIAETEMRPELLDAARAFARHAATRGIAPADLALGWVLANRLVSSVLIGPRTMDQLDAYLAGAPTVTGPEDEAAIDAICPPGSVIGQWSDPRYPFRGRVTGGRA
jgi:aryl-alcohol dehydrogenase-like predicted oxidoreductase